MSIAFDFTNKKVLVTGASKGIGRDICIALVKAGANVVALARDEKALEELKKEYPSITVLVCDVTSDELALHVSSHLPVDCLVNNAGVASLEAVGDITKEAIERTFSVNVTAPLLLSQLVAASMTSTGSIVNVSSQASLRPLDNHAVYCSSKAALDMATRCLAKELGPKGIRVNAVNPTVVLTEMGKRAWGDEKKAAGMLAQMSIKRFAEVSDVVSAVLFLLSDGSAMTTGETFGVDGGFSNQ